MTDRGMGIRVLSTPSLVLLCEKAAQLAVGGALPEGSITVLDGERYRQRLARNAI